MLPIQFIVHHIDEAQRALKGGCRWLRFEAGELPEAEAKEALEKMKSLCAKYQAQLVVNARLSLVEPTNIDGVHLPYGASVKEARETLGEQYLIGATAHTMEEVLQLKKDSADYVDVGPYGTGEGSVSLEDYRRIISELYEKDVTLPLSAFGDITPEDDASLSQAGVRAITTDNFDFYKKSFFGDFLKFLE